jgi:aminoglycoside phosphotransferase (APT) family kinase protein
MDKVDMEREEFRQRLEKFCRTQYGDDDAAVTKILDMPGHAGFSYGFTVASRGRETSWYIRMPPPNTRWVGTADVMRQVEILNALDDTDVPHCRVKWSGEDPQWFGCPYFIVPLLKGDVLRLHDPENLTSKMTREQHLKLGEQIMKALVGIHKVDWQKKTPRLGPPIPLDEDVIRWDRFLERCAEPERFRHAREVRQKLIDKKPGDSPVGVFHGDYQVGNMFCSFEGNLLAVIDWELVGIGSTLNDVGWVATFSDAAAWSMEGIPRKMFLDPDTLVDLYRKHHGAPLPDIGWFRALAAYKFAIISGLNLSLHRRGKRPDPLWEDMRFSIDTLMARALALVDEV